MSVTGTPVFGQAVSLDFAVITAAKNTYNDATNAVLLSTGGVNASLITGIWAVPRATVTASQLQLYYYDGSTYAFIASELMAAYTMAQTTKASPTYFNHPNGYGIISPINPLYLPATKTLLAASGVALAGGIVFTAQRSDL